MRTGGLLHRGQKPTCAPHPHPAVIEVRPVVVRAHCGACGQQVEIFEPGLRDDAVEWWSSHYRPLVDEVDYADQHGSPVGTWRRVA